MSKVILKVEVEEDYLKSIMASTNKTSSDYILLNAIPPTESDDCVSRKAVKNGMIKYGFHASDMTVTEFVEDLPSVLPKRKQGEWIEQSSNKEQGEREHIWWKCSQCGQVIFSETEIDRKEFHAFCSKCGAEMR